MMGAIIATMVLLSVPTLACLAAGGREDERQEKMFEEWKKEKQS